MNSVTLSGFLGADPATRFFESGSCVTEFSIGVGDFAAGEKVTYWFQCKSWGESGQKLAENFRKGKGIEVSGKLIEETWNDTDGKKRSKHIVNVYNWGFPPAKKEGEGKDGEEAKSGAGGEKKTFATKAEYDAWKAQQDAQQPAATKAPF